MKHQLDQVIWYMLNNRPHSAPVLARVQVENLREEWAHTKEQCDLFTPFGKAGIRYATCHGIISEEDAFPTKAEMLERMMSDET